MPSLTPIAQHFINNYYLDNFRCDNKGANVYKLLLKMLNSGNHLIPAFNMQASYQAFSCMVLNCPCCSFLPYSDVTWASWWLKLLTSRLFFQQLEWINNKHRSRLLITQAFGGSPSVTGETRHLSFIPSHRNIQYRFALDPVILLVDSNKASAHDKSALE